MAMGDPAKEPGNPDGCKMDKKKISKMASSLANLADMFSRAATLIENAVNSIASSVRKVGKGTGKSGGGGGGVKDTITTPEEFNKSVKRIKKAQEKKEKAAAQEIYEANMASMKAEKNAREAEEKEIIKAAMRGLSARNAIRLSAEAEENKAQKKEIEARKKYHDSISKEQEKNTNKQIKQLESFQKRQAASIEKYRKAEEKAKSDEEKKKANEQIKEQKQIDNLRNKYSKALAAQEKRKAKEEAKAKSNEEKEIIKAAINGQKARDRIRKAEEKQREDERKQIEKQENEIYKQVPIAFTIGKTLGFFVANVADAVNGASKYIKGFFGTKEKPSELAQQEPIEFQQIPEEYDGFEKINESLINAEAEISDAYQAEVDLIKAQEDSIANSIAALQGFSDAINSAEDALISRIAAEEDLAPKPAVRKTKKAEGFASGGKAMGTDTVPAMLTPGEIVVNKKASKKYGPLLNAINSGKVGGFARGGFVGSVAGGIGKIGQGVAGTVGAAGQGAAGAASGFASGLDASGYQAAANAVRVFSTAISASSVVATTAIKGLSTGLQALSVGVVGPVDMFNKLVGFAGSFVEAVNPALMQQLSLAFKDLQAIIGVGLQPVIAAAVPIIRAFADKLQPVMQALMPTFDQLAQSMIQLSGPVITLLIEGFAALEPVISIVSMAVQGFADILTAIAPIISTVFKEIVFRVTSLATTLQWLIGKMISWIPGTGDTGKKLMESADAAQKTADMYYAGATQVQKAVKEPVKKGASVGAGAQSASFKGISDFGKGLMQAAFSSSTQAAALKTAEYSEKTYNELANMNARMGRVDPAAPAAGVRRAGP